MEGNELLQRISIDPAICGGQACIRGSRIMVYLLLDFMASGSSFEEILGHYPELKVEDLRAAIAFGAHLAQYGFDEIPTTVTH